MRQWPLILRVVPWIGLCLAIYFAVHLPQSLMEFMPLRSEFKYEFGFEMPPGATAISRQTESRALEIGFTLKPADLQKLVSQPLPEYGAWGRQHGMVSLMHDDIIEQRDLRIAEFFPGDGNSVRKVVADMKTGRVIAFGFDGGH